MNEIFATIFESFYFSSPFSDEIYSESLYAALGISIICISLFCVILFYYGINKPSFSRWYHWLVILLINAILMFCIAFFWPRSTFLALGLDFSSGKYVIFALINAIVASLFFIFFSSVLRWWSTNAKGTPFPN